MGVKHRLSIVILLDDFLASVSADAQLDRSNFVSVVVFHIVRLDVWHVFANSVLDGINITYLPTAIDLVEMVNHIAVDNLLGIDDLTVDTLVGGSFHQDGG